MHKNAESKANMNIFLNLQDIVKQHPIKLIKAYRTLTIYYRYLQAQQAGDQDQVNELRDRIYLSVIHLSAQDLNMAIARYGHNSYASCIVQGIHLLVLDINQQMAHLAHVTSLVQG